MSAPHEVLFDRSALEQEWDADCALKLAQAFLDDTRPVIPAIEEALKNQDSRMVCDNAHKLVGCSKVIMCGMLADQSMALEKAAGQSDWQQAAVLFEQLAPVYRELCVQINDYLSAQPAA